jgi:hypothetical protein
MKAKASADALAAIKLAQAKNKAAIMKAEQAWSTAQLNAMKSASRVEAELIKDALKERKQAKMNAEIAYNEELKAIELSKKEAAAEFSLK